MRLAKILCGAAWAIACLPTLSWAQIDVRLSRVVGGFTLPTDIANAGDGSGRLFIVEKAGRIRIVRDGSVVQRAFLDVAARVQSAQGEQGLLGLAFPPDFISKQYFYVNYVDRSSGAGNTIVSRFRVTADRDVADPDSEEVLLRIPQPFTNHNGGQILFGRDGYLYIGMGDGGSAGDPQNNAQRLSQFLGKMLRIDVETPQRPYRVPSDNPFVNTADARPEVWAFGVRNPWRFAFDRVTGDLFIADVGQNRAEEIDFQPASSRGGENYGWRTMEGLQCHNPPQNCNREGLTMPVLEYPRNLGVSVTGGRVYRGARFPAFAGMYFYADFGSGNLWGLRREGSEWVNRTFRATQINPSTFGEDEGGEIYIADYNTGNIFQITQAASPGFSASGVVNAASYAAGLSPGSIGSIYGTGFSLPPGVTAAPGYPLPLELAGVSVTVNGTRAPLYAVASLSGFEQINLQVPFAASGSRASVVVTSGGVASSPVEVDLLQVQPGLFTSDGTAVIAARNGDASLVTRERPARAGDLLQLYATGLGSVDNAPTTGAAARADVLSRSITQPTVTIGGAPAEVLFSGLAPGFAGLYQINVRVGAGSGTGERDVVLTSAGTASRAARIWIE